MASARVGSPICSCQCFTGNWLVTGGALKVVPIFENHQEMVPLLLMTGYQARVIKNQEICFLVSSQQLEVTASTFDQSQVFKELAHWEVESTAAFPAGLLSKGTGKTCQLRWDQ